jgi:hypothetical protein
MGRGWMYPSSGSAEEERVTRGGTRGGEWGRPPSDEIEAAAGGKVTPSGAICVASACADGGGPAGGACACACADVGDAADACTNASAICAISWAEVGMEI